MVSEKELLEIIAARRQQMAEDMAAISRIPAVNPRMNGQGEYQRMQWIREYLEATGMECQVVEAPDDVVAEGVRLNLYTTFPGSEDREKTLWFIAHVDTVATGELSLWASDPFDPVVKDGKIYGLGCEDNTQAVIVALHLARLMQETGLRAKRNISFLFVSDEETGSEYGFHALIERGLFSGRDEALVPDGGNETGDFVEIAEKSQVWLRFKVTGKQGHAAMPDLGVNACSAGMHLGVEVEDTLKREFNYSDPLFDPPRSTFELTQKFSNVASPNVLPGQDIFTIDMRILPRYTVDEVISRIRQIAGRYEREKSGLSVDLEFVTKVEAPPPTPETSPVVQNLIAVLKERGVDARCGGIGGGTCAAILRAQNIPAVVWSNVDDKCHQPNEYVVIDNLVKDAQVFASVIMRY